MSENQRDEGAVLRKRFWRLPPQAYHQLITSRTLRTLRETFFCGLTSAIQNGFRLTQYSISPFKRFGSPSANCVIPLTAFAPLPPFITLRTLREFSLAGGTPANRTQPCAYAIQSVTSLTSFAPLPPFIFSQLATFPKKLFSNRVLQLIFQFGIIRK